MDFLLEDDKPKMEVIKTDAVPPGVYSNCDNCPFSYQDYYDDPQCKLNYTMRYGPFGDIIRFSSDCQLVQIQTTDRVIPVEKFIVEEIEK